MDNGSWEIRLGNALHSHPALVYHNLLGKSKNQVSKYCFLRI